MTTTLSLYGNLRSPRPSCWVNMMLDSVLRSITIWLTAGISTPSLNMSTVNR